MELHVARPHDWPGLDLLAEKGLWCPGNGATTGAGEVATQGHRTGSPPGGAVATQGHRTGGPPGGATPGWELGAGWSRLCSCVQYEPLSLTTQVCTGLTPARRGAVGRKGGRQVRRPPAGGLIAQPERRSRHPQMARNWVEPAASLERLPAPQEKQACKGSLTLGRA